MATNKSKEKPAVKPADTRRKPNKTKMIVIPPRPVGRPQVYTVEVGMAVCDLIASGKSLNFIGDLPNMPARSTIVAWLSAPDKPEFSAQYKQAREDQADSHFDMLIELADAEPRMVTDQNGVTRVDAGYETYRKTRIDTRKWAASKLKHKYYGDKLELAGDPTAPLVTEVRHVIIAAGVNVGVVVK